MPNENQDPKPSLEGFVPEQETPPVETPPAEKVAEEQKLEVEKPAESDSTEKPAEAAASEKTPEQVEADRAFFQKESQDAKPKLGRLQEQIQKQEPEPPAAKPAEQPPPQLRGWPDDLSDMSDEEVRQKYREDPILQEQVREHRTRQMFTELLDERERVAEAKARLKYEGEQTDRVLGAFCAKNNISDEDFHEAVDYYDKLEFRGRPAAVGQLVIDRLNLRMMQGNIQRVQIEAAEKAARAAKTQTQTIQPTGGGPQAPAKPKTIEEKVADKFQPAPGTAAVDKLFDD
jgi:hypothetical protein